MSLSQKVARRVHKFGRLLDSLAKGWAYESHPSREILRFWWQDRACFDATPLVLATLSHQQMHSLAKAVCSCVLDLPPDECIRMEPQIEVDDSFDPVGDTWTVRWSTSCAACGGPLLSAVDLCPACELPPMNVLYRQDNRIRAALIKLGTKEALDLVFGLHEARTPARNAPEHVLQAHIAPWRQKALRLLRA